GQRWKNFVEVLKDCKNGKACAQSRAHICSVSSIPICQGAANTAPACKAPNHRRLGSACVSRAGFGLAPKQFFLVRFTRGRGIEILRESPRSRRRARQHARRARYPAKLARSFSFLPSQSACNRRTSEASCFSIDSTSSSLPAACALRIWSLRKSSFSAILAR